MNILQMEDMVKGLPDQVLMQEAQMPSGQIPQFLALSEVQRRQEMRQRFQPPPQATVADQILQGGIASAMPQEPPQGGMAPPDGIMQGMPMGPEMGPPQGGPPVQMYGGGMVPGGILPYGMADGGYVPGTIFMQAGQQVPTQADIEAAMKTPPYLRTPEQRALLRSVQESSMLGSLLGPLNQAVESVRPSSPQVQAGIPQPAAGPPPAMEPPVAAPPAPPVATPPPALPRPERRPPVLSAPLALASSAVDNLPVEPSAPPQEDVFQRIMGRVPDVFNTLQGLMPEVGAMPDPMRLYPTAASRANPEAAEQYANLIRSMEEAGRSRRAEDIDMAKKAREEAEGPLRASREEARRAAISSALMRLGAGLMAGKPEEGMASAAESVDALMTRAREQEAADRRAINQEYRQAEREAARGERGMADNVFRLQAQKITDDKTEQRELVRDQTQFAQWSFEQMRNQGKDARQAYMDSLRLSLDVSRAVESVLNEELKSKRISKDQYTTTSGALLRTVNETIRQNLPDDIDLSTPEGQAMLNNMAIEMARNQLEGLGISSPDSEAVTVRTPQELAALQSGQRYRGPDGVVRVKP